MENLSPRQQDIVDCVRVEARVSVDDLASRFSVTPQTIRKDLNTLCDLGILQRVHGGAMLASGVSNVSYNARRELSADAKRCIGRQAAELVPDQSSLFINIGTTTEQVAMALQAHKGLLVVTNNLNVANTLSNAPGVDIIVAGGSLRKSDGGIVGASAADFMRQFMVDVAVIGASAIDADGALLDYDYQEVQVARAIIDNARRVILVADGEKYIRKAPVRIGHISEISTLVTDVAPPEALVEICGLEKVEIVVCPGQPE